MKTGSILNCGDNLELSSGYCYNKCDFQFKDYIKIKEKTLEVCNLCFYYNLMCSLTIACNIKNYQQINFLY